MLILGGILPLTKSEQSKHSKILWMGISLMICFMIIFIVIIIILIFKIIFSIVIMITPGEEATDDKQGSVGGFQAAGGWAQP